MEQFKFTGDITLFEAFSGIGTQAMALKRLAKELNFNLKVVGTSEIDKFAIRTYNAIHGDTLNFGDISKIEEIPQVDIFTYSFPCQDVSQAGLKKGFEKGSGTRSGLLWEVERILINQTKIGKLPKVLLLENVKALVNTKNKPGFLQWLEALEALGYKNYWEVLNSKNYGIAQNRERVFVVSVLGDYEYVFPDGFPLVKKLKDFLEDDVDDKFFMSQKQIEALKKTNFESAGISRIPSVEDDVMRTITSIHGGHQEPKISYPFNSREFKTQGKFFDISPTLTKRDFKDPKVVIFDDYNGRVREDQDTIGTITTNIGSSSQGNSFKLIYGGAVRNRPNDNNVNEANFETNNEEAVNSITTVQKDSMVAIFDYKSNVEFAANINEEVSPTQYAQPHYGVIDGIKVRKLTPRESWRLMGITDEDFDKAKTVTSNSQLYAQAGNAIVVDVLYYIFKQLF